MLQFTAYGQSDDVTVTGTVVDAESQVPIPGVFIVEKGTNNGVVTDFDGHYTITLPAQASIEASYLGYTTQTIAVSGQTTIDVQLQVATNSLDQVVVVGYGTQRKGSVTAAVSQIDGDVVTKSPVANVSNSLAGRLSGVKVVQNSGEPGYNSSSINVRGFGTPLVIVDGVPRSFNSIDPSTIASVTVLKDASAAVYGVRAANGVLLITTKEGKLGKPKISINAYTSWQSVTRYPDMLNAYQFALLTDESAINQGQAPIYGPEELEKFKQGAPGYESTNWYDEVVRSSAPQQYYNLNISGATERVNYFMSAGYVTQEGIWKSNDTKYDRFNISSNIEADITDNLSVNLRLSGRLENMNYPGIGAGLMMSGINRNYPTYSPYAGGPEDYYGVTNQPGTNIAALMHKEISGYTHDQRKTFNGQLGLNYKIPWIEGLSAKFNYAYGTNVQHKKDWTQKYELYNYNKETGEYTSAYVGNDPSNLTETYSEGYYQDNLPGNYNQTQVSLNYDNTFGDHHVKGMVLFETLENKGNDFYAYREFLLNLDYLFAGLDANKDNGGGAYEFASAGLVSRFNYEYKEKYMLEAGFRYDGSSKFPQDSRWGFFPFVSAGWNIAKEGFFKENISFFDNFKLRASWGELGDDSASAFQFITGYTYPSGNYIFGNSVIPGLVDRGLANPNITWYKATTTDIGFDAAILDRSLEFTFDWFYRKRTGLLATRAASLPGTFGASLPQENLNSDNTSGVDLSVSYFTNITPELRFNVTANYGYSRSKNDYIERSDFVNSIDEWKNGQAGRYKNVTWGYEAVGQFQNQEEINNWAVQDSKGNTTLRPGDIKYLDYNGDGVISEDDQKPIGKGSTPEITFGLSFGFEYKGFDLSAQLQGAANYTAYFNGELQIPFYNGANSIEALMDRWHRENIYDPNSAWVPGKYPSTITGGNPNNEKYSSFWLKDASYVRLKNIELGYSLPKEFLERIGVQQWRFYVSGHNLFTWDDLDYMDPEAPSGRGRYYPQMRVINVGLNLTL